MNRRISTFGVYPDTQFPGHRADNGAQEWNTARSSSPIPFFGSGPWDRGAKGHFLQLGPPWKLWGVESGGRESGWTGGGSSSRLDLLWSNAAVWRERETCAFSIDFPLATPPSHIWRARTRAKIAVDPFPYEKVIIDRIFGRRSNENSWRFTYRVCAECVVIVYKGTA